MAFFINICLFLLYFVFLLTTTSFTDLLYGFETILLPFENCNVDCKKTAFNITLGIKNICYFINNIDIITGNLLFDFKVILKNKKRKRKELNRVLKIRNFNLSKERTYRVKHKWHFFDIISIIVYLIIWLLLSIGVILL